MILPSSRLECHLTVFCINEIVPGYVVYLVNGENLYIKVSSTEPPLHRPTHSYVLRLVEFEIEPFFYVGK